MSVDHTNEVINIHLVLPSFDLKVANLLAEQGCTILDTILNGIGT
jgi:hypothetical protein